MAKLSKNAVTLLIIIGCLLGFGGVKFYQSQVNRISPIAPEKLPQRAKGHPQAKIKVVEFIDFQCPACAVGSKTLHDYIDQYPGQIYLELRYFPLAMHKHGLISARWAECAARQDKFWPFLDLLLDKQKEWSSLTDATPPFTFIAKEVGLDLDALKLCLDDKTVDLTINADLEEGKMRQIVSTPSYLIKHELVVGVKSLKMKLDELLGVKSKEGQP